MQIITYQITRNLCWKIHFEKKFETVIQIAKCFNKLHFVDLEITDYYLTERYIFLIFTFYAFTSFSLIIDSNRLLPKCPS